MLHKSLAKGDMMLRLRAARAVLSAAAQGWGSRDIQRRIDAMDDPLSSSASYDPKVASVQRRSLGLAP
jgi:hypothetical protein